MYANLLFHQMQTGIYLFTKVWCNFIQRIIWKSAKEVDICFYFVWVISPETMTGFQKIVMRGIKGRSNKAKVAGQASTATAIGTSISGSSVSIKSTKKAKKDGAKSKFNPSKSDRTTVEQKTKLSTNDKKQNTFAKVAAAKKRANEMFLLLHN